MKNLIQIILGSLLLIAVLMILVAVCCCLIVSGRCSDKEEELFNEYINSKNEVI